MRHDYEKNQGVPPKEWNKSSAWFLGSYKMCVLLFSILHVLLAGELSWPETLWFSPEICLVQRRYCLWRQQCWHTLSAFILFYYFILFYFTESECKYGGTERKRERGRREPQAGSMLSEEPHTWASISLTTLGPWPEAKSRVGCSPDWATQATLLVHF